VQWLSPVKIHQRVVCGVLVEERLSGRQDETKRRPRVEIATKESGDRGACFNEGSRKTSLERA